MGVVAIISVVLAVIVLGYFIFRVIKISKVHEIGQEVYKVQGKERIELLVTAGLSGIFFLISAVCLADAKKWELKFIEGFGLTLGPFLFGVALCVAIGALVFY